MSADTRNHRAVSLAVLGWGLVASILLVLMSAAFSFVEVSRARRDLLSIFRTSERSTYLLGHLAQQMSRIRLIVREHAQAGPRSTQGLEAQVEDLDATLHADSRELPPLLDEEERKVWSDLSPQLDLVRSQLRVAARLLDEGRSEEAAQALDGAVPASAELVEALSKLTRMNREGTEAALRAADDRLRILRIAEVTVSLLLLVGIAVVWIFAIRLVRHQRRQLTEYLSRVEMMNSDLNAFAGRVAHDLKNVLAPLSLATTLLRRAGHNPEKLHAASERIDKATSRAVGLVEALLDFSRSGEVRESEARCSIHDELQATLQELEPLAERVGAVVTVSLEGKGDPVVRCSAGLAHVVLRNVIGNAVKFLEGRPERRVHVAVKTVAERWCEILVEDTGPGIPQGAIDRIFEPFFRVGDNGVGGSGIGLSTVKRIVDAHQGRVTVHSEQGIGSQFVICLPLAVAADAVTSENVATPVH